MLGLQAMIICKAIKKNIALIGARGAGKSKLSRRLKKLCEHPVMSTDTLLSYENGGLSIAEIVEQLGWPALRRLEHEILVKLSQVQNVIIDCGGGILVDVKGRSQSSARNSSSDGEGPWDQSEYKEYYSKAKAKLLKKHCHVVYLRCSKRYLIAKNLISSERPALFGDYKKLLKKRMTYYKKAADLTIDMEDYTIEKAALLLHKKYFT